VRPASRSLAERALPDARAAPRGDTGTVRLAVVLEQCLAPVPGGTGRYSREVARALARAAGPGDEVVGVVAWHRGRRRGAAGRRPAAPAAAAPPALVAAWERGPRAVGGGRRRPRADAACGPGAVRRPRSSSSTTPCPGPTRRRSRRAASPGTGGSSPAAVRTAALVVVPTQAWPTSWLATSTCGTSSSSARAVTADLALPVDADARPPRSAAGPLPAHRRDPRAAQGARRPCSPRSARRRARPAAAVRRAAGLGRPGPARAGRRSGLAPGRCGCSAGERPRPGRPARPRDGAGRAEPRRGLRPAAARGRWPSAPRRDQRRAALVEVGGGAARVSALAPAALARRSRRSSATSSCAPGWPSPGAGERRVLVGRAGERLWTAARGIRAGGGDPLDSPGPADARGDRCRS
jgi:hypothetical protein